MNSHYSRWAHRSPYEALLAPHCLAQALKLADPRDLPASEQETWRSVFVDFVRGVSARGAGPSDDLEIAHSRVSRERVARTVAGCRFILISRDPATHFESGDPHVAANVRDLQSGRGFPAKMRSAKPYLPDRAIRSEPGGRRGRPARESLRRAYI